MRGERTGKSDEKGNQGKTAHGSDFLSWNIYWDGPAPQAGALFGLRGTDRVETRAGAIRVDRTGRCTADADTAHERAADPDR